jgi:hypothetical protein
VIGTCANSAREKESEVVVAPFVAARKGGIDRRPAHQEAALGLVVEHRNELGAVVGLAAQRLARDDDRGSRQCSRRDAIEHILWDGDAVERVLGAVPVQSDPVPGDALHVRHPGIVIEGRVVVLLLLDVGEHAGWRLASRGAGRHRRAQDPSVGVVESDLLAADRHDRHDRLACLAWGVRFHGLRWLRLLGGGSGRRGDYGRQRDRGQERHNGSRGPPPQHLGSRARAGKTKADEAKCGEIFPQMPSPPTAELRGIVQVLVHETPHRVIAFDHVSDPHFDRVRSTVPLT